MASTVRRAHVKRCYGFNELTREIDESIWIDVLRIDEVSFDVHGDDDEPKSKVGKISLPMKDPDTKVRRVTLFIKWEDSGSELEDLQKPSRQAKVMKCVDQSQPAPGNVNLNPDLHVPIKVVDKITLTEEGRGVTYVFKNRNVESSGERIPTSRQISTIRLFHYDTTVDNRLTTDTPIIPDFSEYQVTGTADKGDVEKQNDGGQWFDFELIRSFPYKLGGSTDGQTAQDILLTFTHKPMFESIGIDLEQAGAPSQKNASDDDIIAARMDPFQQIINVQWGGALRIDESSPSGVVPTITIPSLGLADSPFFSMSLCFRVKPDVNTYNTELFEISSKGLTVDSSSFESAPGVRINMFYAPGLDFGLEGFEVEGIIELFVGAEEIINIHDFSSFANDSGDDPFAANDETSWRPYTSILMFIPTGTYNRDDYNHLLVSVFTDVTCTAGEIVPDELHGSVYPLLTGPRFNATLNGVRLFTEQDAPNRLLAPSYELAISHATGDLTGGLDVDPTPADTFPSQFTNENGSFAKQDIPGFDIGYSNLDLSIPRAQWNNTPSGPSGFKSLDFYDMRMWNNQFISTGQLPLFLRAVDGRGVLEPASTAEQALGKPQIWLTGGPTSFVKNKGSVPLGQATVFEQNLLTTTSKPSKIVLH